MKWVHYPSFDVGESGGATRQKAKYLVDESLGIGAVEILRSLGWNVKSVWDFDLQGRQDEAVFAAAIGDNRVLLSHDTDFLDDRRFPLRNQPGIFILPGGQGMHKKLSEAISRVVRRLHRTPSLRQDTKIHVQIDGEFNVKTLDPSTGGLFLLRAKFDRHGRFWACETDELA